MYLIGAGLTALTVPSSGLKTNNIIQDLPGHCSAKQCRYIFLLVEDRLVVWLAGLLLIIVCITAVRSAQEGGGSRAARW